MPRSLRLLAVAAASLSAGCAFSRVEVVYPKPETAVMRARALALGNLYLLVERPKAPEDTIGGRAASAFAPAALTSFPVAADVFARAAAKALAREGGWVLAYRATEDAGQDPYLEKLKPAGTLRVSFRTLSLDRSETEKEVKVKDKDGGERTEKRYFWHFKARLELEVLLRSEADGEVLAQFPYGAELEQEVPRTPGEDKTGLQWYEEAQDDLLGRAAEALPRLFGRMPSVRRTRTVYTDEKDPGSVAARRAASKGDWEGAAGLWAARLDSGAGGWRELMDLAAASEVRREFQEAGRVYRLARERAAAGPADPEAAKVPWDALLAEVEEAVTTVGQRSTAAREWFGVPVAVLPFSDETTSVEGPEMLRSMVHEALRGGGYSVLPLDDVDRALREHGYSQGGQLRRVRPAKLAGWVEARRLVFGHITHFEDVMLGVYGRRKVAGTLSLWDGAAGDRIWTGDRPAEHESGTLDAGAAVGRFMGQLLRGFAERVVHKPLYAESADFVTRNLETLPLAPER